MGVQTLCSKAAIERFDEGVVGGLARPGEVERHAALVRPQIQIPRDTLGTLIDARGEIRLHACSRSYCASI
jgi:hypothetical protein